MILSEQQGSYAIDISLPEHRVGKIACTRHGLPRLERLARSDFDQFGRFPVNRSDLSEFAAC